MTTTTTATTTTTTTTTTMVDLHVEMVRLVNINIPY
jgi:hypothetical protein